MNIRSPREIKSLDEDLHLFDDEHWDFLAVVDEQAENYEYFDDIRDTDFRKRSYSFSWLIPVLLVFLCAFSVYIYISLSDKGDVDAIKNISSVASGTGSVDRVNGVPADSKVLIEVSKQLQLYAGVLQQSSDYADLNSVVKDGSSVAEEYDTYKSSMETMYDINDCYARFIKNIGSAVRVNRINEILVKDGVYYVYCDVSLPEIQDIREYVYLYDYNLTKEFTHKEITEENVGRYLADLMNTNRISSTSCERCFEFEESNGVFKLRSDSWLSDHIGNCYSEAISMVTQMLSENLTVGK